MLCVPVSDLRPHATTRSARDLDTDELAPGALLQVVLLRGDRVGAGPVRAPHRHAYHELIWVRSGAGEHLIDGASVPVHPGTITVIGRGQIHQFRHARDLDGAVVRFSDEALEGAGGRIAPARVLADASAVAVPPGDAPAVDALTTALAAEARRPPDPYADDVVRHLVGALLLWIERWDDGGRGERPAGAGDPATQLHRRFTQVLERDFARHHDARHYADALAVPAAALSKALAERTGRTTKALVTGRVMLEAARLLRHTDKTVGEIAHAVGYTDQLYFSRAFKRHAGASPQAYREAARGGA
jgi:AraC family transcriptional activator of pobA